MPTAPMCWRGVTLECVTLAVGIVTWLIYEKGERCKWWREIE